MASGKKEDSPIFRYRIMSDHLADPARVGGDMTFGHGGRDFAVDSPTSVAQAILTRLLLFMGEWFLNTNDGMPWFQEVLGHPYRSGIPDAAIRQRIIGTPYTTQLLDYRSNYSSANRILTVSAKVFTAFGQVTRAPVGALMTPSGDLVIPLPIVPVPCAESLSPLPIAAPLARLR